MPKFYFRLDLGDLVNFKASRVTEDYIDDTLLTGIIVEQRYVFTADNRYKVRTGDQDYWIGEDKLTLISGTKNKT
mgnify:FL=1|jgi:hypothetical protein|tara:strand:+ start:593 stop:817 length:225 start_codon:yes stop_codon:yes gene_type:complete